MVALALSEPAHYLQHCVDDALAKMQDEPWYHSLFNDAGGKMFGVLVVESAQGRDYLTGFSGMLGGQWLQQGFVPPVFDTTQAASILGEGERAIADLSAQLTESGLQEKCVAAAQRLADFDITMNAELSRLQFRLARRKQHRKIHRTWLLATESESKQDIASNSVKSRLAQLDRQSQFDKKERKLTHQNWREKRQELSLRLRTLDTERQSLLAARAQISSQTQSRLFTCYNLTNPAGRTIAMSALFKQGLPPGGAGDCAAPKLLHYANSQGLSIIAMTEFWVGASPDSGVRRHGYHYSPCRAKCDPLIPWLTGGSDLILHNSLQHNSDAIGIESAASLDVGLDVIYDDESITVINKPVGLLSTPGKTIKDSVYTRFARQFRYATGPLLVHRLDMDTSGLLLLSKNATAHKALQAQFIKRTVLKRYIAVLDGKISRDSGTVTLPLRVDLDDRPRQLVCRQHGKAAQTRYTVLQRKRDTTRVAFEPITGRTHQLRVHAAHIRGLNAPIVGDPLYGRTDKRMMLHAESITFTHPLSGERVDLSVPAPF